MQVLREAATFTPVKLDEMQTFLRRAFYSLRPEQTADKGEAVFHLFLNGPKTIGIKVWSSVCAGQDVCAVKGADAIRVQFYNFGKNRPFLAGSEATGIVRRTGGWRTHLQARIEDFIEMYADREEYWESRTR